LLQRTGCADPVPRVTILAGGGGLTPHPGRGNGRVAEPRARPTAQREPAVASSRRAPHPSRAGAGPRGRLVTISPHVLDAEHGRPGAGVRVELWREGDLVGGGETDADGRIRELGSGEPGRYRIVFHPPSPFFRRVELELELGDGHHHVPLLISS